MKSFARYLSYRLEQSILRTVVFTVLSVLLAQNVISDAIRGEPEYATSGLSILAVIISIFSAVIPMMESARFKKRRNLDAIFSFPISRGQLALVNYLSGWIQVFVIYSVTFTAAYPLWASKSDLFALSHLLPYYLFSIGIGLVMYSFFLFLFGEANSVTDGVIFCILGIYLLYLLSSSVCLLLSINMNQFDFDLFWMNAFAPIDKLTTLFQDRIHLIYQDPYYGIRFAVKSFYMFAVWAVIGVACTVGYFLSFVRQKAEKAGDISDSWFGYRTMVPIYAYSAFLWVSGIEFVGIIIWILMFAGYFIYRRSFRLKVSDIVVIACSLIPMLYSMTFH